MPPLLLPTSKPNGLTDSGLRLPTPLRRVRPRRNPLSASRVVEAATSEGSLRALLALEVAIRRGSLRGAAVDLARIQGRTNGRRRARSVLRRAVVSWVRRRSLLPSCFANSLLADRLKPGTRDDGQDAKRPRTGDADEGSKDPPPHVRGTSEARGQDQRGGEYRGTGGGRGHPPKR